ncbi:MAG TPA: RHS repeat-associated core domain-containing protein [Rhodanobacter sp.]|nr:RHS repeat-associated core domain-containing protein [Rhodanobacter sp.]
MKGHIFKIVAAMLWMLCHVAHAGTVTYVYTDPQGTPLAEADASGNITARFDYAPYGTAVASMSPAPNGPGYTGHVNDPDTGLVYMQARYYDPVVGRFLNTDPVVPSPGNAFNFNRYAYVNNNPIMGIDPTGMQDCSDTCMKMRALSNHFSNMAAGVSDENAAAGMSAHGGGDWAHPGKDPILNSDQKMTAGVASFVTGQIASAMNDFEDFANAEANGEPPSIGSTIGVFSIFTPIGPEAREASIAEKIIAETFNGKGNILSSFIPLGGQALDAGLKFLGKNYTEIDRGVFRSSDGLRQFRMEDSSLTGGHRPGVPHVHFELYMPGARKPYVNNHVPFSD